MKLRNKKTGEIVRVEFLNNWQTDDGTEIGFRVAGTLNVYSYNSLAELNEEWEDYKLPKKYWYIDSMANIYNTFDESDDFDNERREVGNYFETREEAEKAVLKLKAWKRLKDAGLKFTDFNYNLDETSSSTISADGKICFEMMCYKYFSDDLDLLFGGEK